MLEIDSEIVYLTAYTAASLNGTITRGMEGTTAAAHTASAAPWKHAATLMDYYPLFNIASDHGLLGVSLDPAMARDALTIVSGTVTMFRVFAPPAALLNTVWLSFSAGGTTLTAGDSFVGIYDATGTRLAVSADQAANWTTAGMKQISLTSAATVPTTMPPHVYVAIVCTGSTPPTLRGLSTLATMTNLNLPLAQNMASTGPTGQTSLPTTITMSSNAQYGSLAVVGVS